ncbi:hypothetical protein L7F22_001254 [Adiantum nelumboides]|nr:hypothetical protein [Adiantum nelumboides]
MVVLKSNIEGDATQTSIQDVDVTPSISTTQGPTTPLQVDQHATGSSRKRGRRSSTLQDIWAPSLKKQAEIAEERFFYQCNIAFHASRTGAYKRFVNAISAVAAAGAPITPVGSEALRTTRLTRQTSALRVLSQEVSSSGAERLWSIMGDIHTKDRNRFSFCKLNTPQLDRLAFVNANLRVLEKAGGLESAGPISWLLKQVDHRQIVVEAADVSQLQPHTVEDDVYDFIREDMMRFT